MNNITVILRNPESLALDAIERLQRWWRRVRRWSRSLALLKFRWFTVAQPTGFGGGRGALWIERKQVVELHSSVEYVVWF